MATTHRHPTASVFCTCDPVSSISSSLSCHLKCPPMDRRPVARLWWRNLCPFVLATMSSNGLAPWMCKYLFLFFSLLFFFALPLTQENNNSPEKRYSQKDKKIMTVITCPILSAVLLHWVLHFHIGKISFFLLLLFSSWEMSRTHIPYAGRRAFLVERTRDEGVEENLSRMPRPFAFFYCYSPLIMYLSLFSTSLNEGFDAFSYLFFLSFFLFLLVLADYSERSKLTEDEVRGEVLYICSLTLFLANPQVKVDE